MIVSFSHVSHVVYIFA